MTRPPLVLAHRGFHRRAPENSAAALDDAARLGCDGVEFDVRGLADGTLVLHHEATVRRGRRRVPLSSLTPAELRRCPGPAATAPRLREVLRWAARRPRLLLDVELKEAGACAAAEALLSALASPDRFVVTSFDRGIVEGVKRRQPAWRVGWIHDGDAPGLARAARDAGMDLVVLPAGRLRARTVTSVRDAGPDVWTWGARFVAPARRLAAMGVSAFITDAPDRLLRLHGGTASL